MPPGKNIIITGVFFKIFDNKIYLYFKGAVVEFKSLGKVHLQSLKKADREPKRGYPF